MSRLRSRLLAATLLAGLGSVPAPAEESKLVPSPVPPLPSADQIENGTATLGNPLNQPITGAAEKPRVVGGETPPSLEQLQATRPGDEKGDGLDAGRGDQLHQSALTYGAQGGLAARAFALNEMLRRYQAQLDSVYDFKALVLPVGTGQTLMRPPVVTEAEMAFALGDNAQVARETSCIYQITREAQLASAPPNWRSYLVRSWASPERPADAGLPHSDKEVAYWNKWVAEGWAAGERQAVEIFLSDLGRLQRDIVGMARYRVLLRAGLIEGEAIILFGGRRVYAKLFHAAIDTSGPMRLNRPVMLAAPGPEVLEEPERRREIAARIEKGLLDGVSDDVLSATLLSMVAALRGAAKARSAAVDCLDAALSAAGEATLLACAASSAAAAGSGVNTPFTSMLDNGLEPHGGNGMKPGDPSYSVDHRLYIGFLNIALHRGGAKPIARHNALKALAERDAMLSVKAIPEPLPLSPADLCGQVEQMIRLVSNEAAPTL